MNGTIIGSSIVGVVLLVWGGLRLWKKKPIKLTTWLWVGAGLTLGGSLVEALRNLVRAAAGPAGTAVGLTANVVIGLVGLAAMWVVWQEAPLRKGRGAGPTRPALEAGPGGPGRGGGKVYIPILGLLAPILILTTTGFLGNWARSLSSLLGRLGGPLSTFFGA